MTNNFVHTFLFHDEPVMIQEQQKISAQVVMDSNKEGWLGIPHGGIGMGALMDLSAGFEHCYADGDFNYPIQCHFKMGGSAAKVGDQVAIEAVPTESGIAGQIRILENDAMPYITGEIAFGADQSEQAETSRTYMPDNFSQIENPLMHIPHYRNCFVCGVERSSPGLKRKFHLWKSSNGPIVCAFSGFNENDRETVHRFQRNGFLHPICPLAILDETMGWGGFMAFAQGGVSVRLHYTLSRRIGVNEKVVFFGKGEKVKGNINKHMLFWASGCAAVMHQDGSLETVIVSSGQWYAMQALTDQMRTELIPDELTRKIFSIAEGHPDSPNLYPT